MKKQGINNFLFPLLITLLVLISGTGKSHSQVEDDKPVYRSTINFLPLYMFVEGLRIDYDRSITRNHWIQAGPVIFLNDNQHRSLLYDYPTRQQGVGLHLYHRYYPGRGFGETPYYISYGGVWHYNNMSYEEPIDGFRTPVKTKLHRGGPDVIIGISGKIGGRLVIDLYTGMGLRFVSFSSDTDDSYRFDEVQIMPGYAGTVFLMGIRLGFAME
jgi:hypothetical protein